MILHLGTWDITAFVWSWLIILQKRKKIPYDKIANISHEYLIFLFF